MSEWWTYTIADFLMYSARTYYRLIERFNSTFWPLHLLGVALGIAILVAAIRRPAWSRAVLFALAVSWAFVAVGWFWLRFRGISTGAGWFAAVFGIEALLLAMAASRTRAAFPEQRTMAHWIGIALLVVALAYPLLAITSGRGVRQSEVFGLLPDPTALGTIGTLLLMSGRWRRRLMIIPVAWCLISGAMLWAMRQEQTEWRTGNGLIPSLASHPSHPTTSQNVANIASRRS